MDANRSTDVLLLRGIHSLSRTLVSTGIKSKGLEFDQVWLADDFMRFFEEGRELTADEVDQADVNLLYVALTRAKASVRLCESFNEWLSYRRLRPR